MNKYNENKMMENQPVSLKKTNLRTSFNSEAHQANLLSSNIQVLQSPKKIKLIQCLSLTLFSLLSFSSNAALTFGDQTDAKGQLKVSGALRAKYIYEFDQEPSSSKLSFADAVLWLDYESPKWLGRIDYRAYDYYGHIGDANWLTDAWLGYKIDDQSKIIAGLNPVPFGHGRFWGNTFYLGIANAAGLEDVHNLGVKYEYINPRNELQIAYYPRDGGNFTGRSKDSQRFSVNPVHADDYVPQGTYTSEKNAFVLRGTHTFPDVFQQKDLNVQIGASAWYSEIENHRSNKTGDRQVAAIFSDFNYQQWNLKALAAYQDIDNADEQYKNHITLGGFDSSFNSATKGQIYSAELSYLFANKIGPLSNVRPYVNYSSYIKDESGFKDSTRIIPGVAFSYDKFTVQAELLIAKHDPYIGDSEGLAAGGDDDWYKRAYVSIGYYF